MGGSTEDNQGQGKRRRGRVVKEEVRGGLSHKGGEGLLHDRQWPMTLSCCVPAVFKCLLVPPILLLASGRR